MIKHEYFPLSTILYYRIGGMARYLLDARSRDEILESLEFVRESGIDRLMIVGHGSNLLFPDGLFDGAVLRIAAGDTPQIHDGGEGRVDAFAGEALDDVVKYGFERGYVGLQWAGGLPGTVGAAVRGNVGAFGGEVKHSLLSAELLDLSSEGLQMRMLDGEGMGFSYRNSIVKEHHRLLVVSATFQLRVAEFEELAAARDCYRANIEYRETNHPMEYPTCGSVFKNIADNGEVEKVLAVWPDIQEMVEGRWHGKVSMGYAINRFGLRGYQIGDARISLKHSNFIVNLGNARYSDVCGLIGKVKEQFIQTFGFAPEAEVEILE